VDDEIFIADNSKAGDEDLIAFPDWIRQELNRRGWDQSELARRAGVVPSTISMIINEQKQPGPEACLGIARAFKEAPAYVFRLAGLLPELKTSEEKIERLNDLFDQLSPEDQARLILVVRAWLLAPDDEE